MKAQYNHNYKLLLLQVLQLLLLLLLLLSLQGNANTNDSGYNVQIKLSGLKEKSGMYQSIALLPEVTECCLYEKEN